MRINHFTILADDLPAVRDFFVDVIGFEEGWRPPFAFNGHWLYSEGVPQVHLASAGRDPGRSSYLGRHSANGNSAIDHVALSGADYPALVARLKQSGMEWFERRVPESHEVQVFVPGPEGLKVEFLFPDHEPSVRKL